MAYLQIKQQDVKLVDQIGSGGYSSVFKALWKGQEVAAKRLTTVDKHEVEILSELDHPNVVKLIGLVDENFEMLLILELCKGGSLRSYLDQLRSKGERLPPLQFCDWAKQAARPIQYLKQMGIVHKDVKSLNYLIADGNVLKLADFGLAKRRDSTMSNATGRVTHAWMAPELLKEFKLSPKYDNYSYGVVVWELWTTEIPFEGADPVNIIWRVCKNNERPPIPPDCPKPIADLLRQCWETDWSKRPSIDQCLVVLTATEKTSRQRVFVAGPWVPEKVFGQDESGKLSDAVGIAVNPNGDVAVADRGAAQVKVYSSEGNYKFNMDTNLNPGTNSQPWNVTISSQGNYYVTDQTQYVKVYSVNGRYNDKWVTVSPDNTPSDTEHTELRGLAIDAKDQVFVGEYNHRYISKHNQDGSHIASIKVDIRPHYLAVTSQDTIIVSDWAGHVVKIVDNTGEVLHTLKPPPVAHWRPRGVCCYEEIIFICNLCPSYGICYVSVSGEYLGYTAGTVMGPRGITFVQGSKQLLVSCKNKVQVYSSKQ